MASFVAARASLVMFVTWVAEQRAWPWFALVFGLQLAWLGIVGRTAYAFADRSSGRRS